jgi:hypothetical protein
MGVHICPQLRYAGRPAFTWDLVTKSLYSLSILCGRFAKYQICYAMCYETRLAVPRSGGRTCPYDSGCEFCVGGKLGSRS